MVVPLTGKLSAQRFPHTVLVTPTPQNGLSCPSVLLVFQLRAIDKRRLGNPIGRLEGDAMRQVEQEMKDLLSL
jgi:mRNA interferase MazF